MGSFTNRPAGLSRRGVLAAGAGAALAVPALAACGDDGSSDPGGQTATDTPDTATQPGGSQGNGELARLSDIPVGGAVSATGSEGKPVIVAQPRQGEVVAFSAVCTHRGCTVAPADGILRCPCHGSTFDPATGDNTGGPAPSPLAEVKVTVRAGVVSEA